VPIKVLPRYGGRFSIFKMAAFRRLGFVIAYVCLDNRRVFGGLSHCAKFGWNRCCSFDSMQALMFCAFGLKMPTPPLGVLSGKNETLW